MRPDLANRIIFLLSGIGAFIALYLTISKFTGVAPACGKSLGCATVHADEWSIIGPMPTAVWGLVLYLAVGLFSMCRIVLGLTKTPKLGAAIWVLCAAGTLGSLALLYHAFNDLDAACGWCIASGVVMALMFIVFTFGQSSEETAVHAGFKNPASFGYPVAMLAASLVTAFATGLFSGQTMPVNEIKAIPAAAQLVRPDSPMRGKENAPIQVVVFSDFTCGTCRMEHDWLDKEMSGRLKGKIKMYYRFFPLMGSHPNGVLAAAAGELARQRGKFWEYFGNMFHQTKGDPNQDRNIILEALKDAGIDEVEIAELEKGGAFTEQMTLAPSQGLADGRLLGVDMTPSWFVTFPDGKTFSTTGGGIRYLMSDRYIESHSSAGGR